MLYDYIPGEFLYITNIAEPIISLLLLSFSFLISSYFLFLKQKNFQFLFSYFYITNYIIRFVAVIILMFFCFVLVFLMFILPISYLETFVSDEIPFELHLRVKDFYLPVLRLIAFLIMAPILLRVAFALPSTFETNPLGYVRAFKQARGWGWPMTKAICIVWIPISLLFGVVPAYFRIRYWLDADFVRGMVFLLADSVTTSIVVLFVFAVISKAYETSASRSIEEIWD